RRDVARHGQSDAHEHDDGEGQALHGQALAQQRPRQHGHHDGRRVEQRRRSRDPDALDRELVGDLEQRDQRAPDQPDQDEPPPVDAEQAGREQPVDDEARRCEQDAPETHRRELGALAVECRAERPGRAPERARAEREEEAGQDADPAGARRGGDRRRHATSDWREVCDGKDRRRPRRRQPCPRPVAGIAGRLPERHLRRVPRPLATPGHRTAAMMEDLLRQWDGECVVVRYDHQTDTWIYIAIHDRTLGMAMGGCRMNVYPTPADGLKDALRLAHGMTYKWAAIGFPFGGGKSVLAVPRRLEGEEREGLLVRFGEIIEGLGGAYGGGVDLGTTPEDMNVIGRATSRVFGRTLDHGGAGDPGPWTALGVYAGI